MSDLVRVRDWRARLSDLIEERRRLPFSDQNNCGVFAVDCIMAMTGMDILKPFRDQLATTKTIAEGLLLLRNAGYAQPPDFIAAHLDEIPPSAARAGDVMMFNYEGGLGWSCGIVNGERVTVMGLQGLGTVSRSDALRAFRVP
jgi:hypothetical protein